MTIRGVLIDFSGTLFRLEPGVGWLPEQRDTAEAERLLQALTAPVRPGDHLPGELIDDWARRDLDPDVHRVVYTESLRRIGLSGPGEAEEGYRRMLDPASWLPYPDTRATLERLRDKGIPVAVVSNIAWDIRTSFDRYDITGLVAEFVLSFQEGSIKPDEKMFRVACDRLGVDPAEALMIGDSEEADGAAAALGCHVDIVPALPTTERPGALLAVLDRRGL